VERTVTVFSQRRVGQRLKVEVDRVLRAVGRRHGRVLVDDRLVARRLAARLR
jgi:hypothetical protein